MSGSDFSLGSLGFARVAVVAPELKVADVRFNTRAMLAALEDAASRGSQLVLFPELGITGYTCADLFYQSLLRNQARAALSEIAEATSRLDVAAVVGLPVEAEGKLYNCAAFIANGAVLGLVPKTYLPNTNEYYEDRWFTSARECTVDSVRARRSDGAAGCRSPLPRRQHARLHRRRRGLRRFVGGDTAG